MLQFTSGRRAGKSYMNQHWQTLYGIITNMRPHPIKVSWRPLPGNKLQAYVDPEGLPSVWGLKEEDMDPIQEWSNETGCGKRMSFDLWKFKSKKEITMFLLRWS
jgi:hypothetical protein